MAEETLTLRMRTNGTARTVADVKAVDRAIEGIDERQTSVIKTSKRMDRGMTALGAAASMLIARFLIMGAVIGTLVVGLGALAAAVAFVAAGFLATLGPAVLIGIAAVMAWEKQVKIAHSAAWELKKATKALQKTFLKAFSPAASIVMESIAKSFRIIEPLVRSLGPPARVFAKFLGQAIKEFADGMRQLGPELRGLFRAVGPLLPMMVDPLLTIARLFLDIATASAKWTRSAKGQRTLKDVWEGIKTVFEALWGIIKPVGRILGKIVDEIGKDVGGGLIKALEKVGKWLTWIADNWETAKPYVYAFIAALGAMAVAAGLAAVALWLMNMPILLIIGAIAAVAVLLYFAYKRVGWFRDAIDWLWQAMKDVAEWIKNAFIWVWNALVDAFNWCKGVVKEVVRVVKELWEGIKDLKPIIEKLPLIWLIRKLGGVKGIADKVKTAFVAVRDWIKHALHDVIDFVKPKVKWLIEKLEKIMNAIKWVTDKLPSIPFGGSAEPGTPGLGGPIGDRPPAQPTGGIPSGGGMRRGDILGPGGQHGITSTGKPLWVGEAGPELVSLPTGSRVHSNEASRQKGEGPTFIEATFIMPDGEVLARQTVRAARRKQSTR